jgi:hypothetical protein
MLAGEGFSGLSKVRWAGGGKWLVSVAAREKVLFQWAYSCDGDGAADASAAKPLPLDAAAVQFAIGADADAEVIEGFGEATGGGGGGASVASGGRFSKAAASSASSASSASLAASALVSASSSTTVPSTGGSGERKWVAALVEPSDVALLGDPLAPLGVVALSLDRTFGVRASAGARNVSIGYGAAGEAVFSSASVVVTYDKAAHAQRLFKGDPPPSAAVCACAFFSEEAPH